MNEELFSFLLFFSLAIGPSKSILEPKVPISNFPENRFLLPSLVLISITEDIRPPYSDPKPALYTSALFKISVSKTENNPIE